MSARELSLLAALTLVGWPVAAQEMPTPAMMQVEVQKIVQERPREAEAAARAFLMLVAPDRVAGLDSLKAASVDGYWMEVAQLTVQFGMVQGLNRRDSVRAGLVAQMFGTEVQARARQRAYRGASESARQALRRELETLITLHFTLEDRLRALEIADIERRLGEIRTEHERRRQQRAELVRWAVEDAIRDATRPF